MVLQVRKPLPRPSSPLVGSCPNCTGTVHSGRAAFYCINYRNGDCNFYFRKDRLSKLGKKWFNDAEMSKLLRGEPVNLYNLLNKEGNTFSKSVTLEFSDKYDCWGVDFGPLVPNSSTVVRRIPLPKIEKK